MNNNKKDKRIGEEKYNSQGYLMKIIEYNNVNDMTVEFHDKYKARINTRYSHFSNGDIKNPYHPDLYNVGINGNKYPSRKNGQKTKEYRAWSGILVRCYDEKYREENQSYKEVTCCKEWLLFENFYEWLHSQENFDKWLSGEWWAVDKDILVKGNKIYAPEMCSLVPPNINGLFTKCDKSRGELPIGVSKHRKKYRAGISINKHHIILPVRDTIEEAFVDYKNIKEENIKKIAQEEYNMGNITKKCYEAMMRYEVEITD